MPEPLPSPRRRVPAAWAAALLVFAGLAAPRASAATLYWDVTTGTWSSTASWSSTLDGLTPAGGPPTNADVAFFSATLLTSAPTVTLTTDTVIGGLQFGAGSTGTTVFQTDGTARTLTIGTDGVVLDAGSTQNVTVGGAAGQAITILLDGSQTWTNASSGTLTISNGVQRTGTDGTSRTLTLGGLGAATFAGIIANGGTAGTLSLTKVENGTVHLLAANTFSGGVTLSQGTIRVGNAAALGTGTLTWTGGTLTGTNQAAAFTLANRSSVSGTIQLGDAVNTANLTLSGNMALTGNTTISAFGNGQANWTKDIIASGGGQVISGTISGTFALAKDGAGTLVLSAANTFTGGITIRQGILRVGNAAALGSGTATILGGQLSSNSATAYTLANAVTLGGDVTLGDGLSNGTLTFSGTSTLTGNRTLITPSAVTYTGPIASAGFGFTKQGGGTLTLSASNTYTGATVVDAGSLTLSGSLTGSILGSTAITVNRGALLSLTNVQTTDNSTNRLGDSAAITLAGGTFAFSNSGSTAAATFSETTGALTLTGTQFSTLALTGTTGTATLTFASIARGAMATLNLSGTTFGPNNRVVLTSTTGLGLVNSISPWVTVSGSDFATYSTTGTTSLLPLPAASYTTGAETGWVATNNVKVTANAVTLTASRSINSIVITPTSSGTVAIGAGNTLTLGSGGLLFSSGAAAATVTGGTLTAGAANVGGELVVHQFSGNAATVSAAIADNGTGPVSLTKSGNRTLVLTGANTYSGGTVITSNTLQLGSSTALGSASGRLVVGAGGVLNTAGFSPTIATLSGAGTITNSTGTSVVTVTNGTFLGTVTNASGFPLGITKTGAGTLSLAGINTLTGTTTVAGGTLAVVSSLGGPLTAGASTGITVDWGPGLTGQWIASTTGVADLASLTTLNARINSVSPTAQPSSIQGQFFDFGNNTTGAVNWPLTSNETARFNGQFFAAASGTYAFYTNSDDGSVLFINGQQVVFNNYSQGNVERSGTVVLSAGSWNDIVIGHYNGSGGYGLNASVQAPGGAKQLLSNALLRSAPVVGSLTTAADVPLVFNGGGLVVSQSGTTTAAGTISGTGSLTKTGAGTLTISGSSGFTGGLSVLGGVLAMTNPANTFSGTIQLGVGLLSVNSDGALGNAANPIYFGNSASGGLMATSSFTTSRFLDLATGATPGVATTSAIQVTSGATLTLTGSIGDATAASQVLKFNNGTLVLAAPGPLTWSGSISAPTAAQTLTGGLRIDAGTVRLTNGSALGAATNVAGVNATIGAAIELSGGITVPNQLSGNTATTGASGGLYGGFGLGSIASVGGTNTITGLVSSAGDWGFGAAAGSVLNVAGGVSVINTGRIVSLLGDGDINFTTTPLTSGSLVVYKLGAGTTTFTVPVTVHSSGLRNYGGGGVLALAGSGSLSVTTAPITLVGGGGFRVDNSVSAISNRTGGSMPVTMADGVLAVVASSTAAVTETFGTVTANGGGGEIRVTTTDQPTTIVGSSLAAVGGGGSLVFRAIGSGSAFGSAANTVRFTTAPSLTNGLLLGGFTSDAAGVNFATYGASVSGSSIQAFAAYDTSNDLLIATNTATPLLTANAGTPTRTLNALATSGAVTLSARFGTPTLTLSSGQLLVSSGSATLASDIVVAGPTTDFQLAAADGASLTVAAPLTNTANVNKSLGGTLTFTGRQFFNTNVNWFTLMGGTTVLAAGDNTLYPGQGTPGGSQNLVVASGATLDLNGNVQVVGALRSGSNTPYANTAGVITSAAPATLVIRSNNNPDQWGGRITGPITLVQNATANTRQFYSDNTYTGTTAITGGVVQLQDAARLSATAGVELLYGQLTITNAGQFGLADRVNDAAPITMRGGVVAYLGRANTDSTETLGTLVLTGGVPNVYVSPGGTGTNSAVLTMAAISRSTANAATVNFANGGTAAQNAQPGNTGRLVFAVEPTLANNLIGPWAIAAREWATYQSGLGTGQLGGTGLPGYSSTTLAVGSNPTSNVRITTGTTLAGAATINTLNVNYGTGTNSLALSGTLTLAGGGLMLATGNENTLYSVTGGALTSGTGTAADLYIWHLPWGGTNRQAAIASPVIDNGSGQVRLVLASSEGAASANAITLSGSNTYTGGTVLQRASVTLGGTAGQVIIPSGALTLFNSTITTTATGGVIAPTNSVTLDGYSTLSLGGPATLANLVFNNSGGVTNPTVTATGTLTLTGSITATSQNTATVATLAGTIDFGGTPRTLTVAPIAYSGRTLTAFQPTLAISGSVRNAGVLSVTGGGVLLLSGSTSSFAGGLSVDGTSAVQFGAGSQGAVGAVTAGPLGTGTLSLAAGARILSATNTAYTVNNNVVLGGNVTFDGISFQALTLGGTSFLPAGSSTITVVAPQSLFGLGALADGGGSALVKAGYGTLILGGASGVTGGLALNQGTLRLSNTAALGSGPLTINGGNLDSGVASLVLSTSNAQTWAADFQFLGTNSLNLGPGGVTLPATRTVNVIANTLAVGGVGDGGSGYGVIKTGGGTLAIAGASTYTGTTSVLTGTFQVGAGGATGSLASASVVDVAAGSVLAFNRSDDYGGTFANLITGSGAVQVVSGTLTLGNTANSFTGGLRLGGGVLLYSDTTPLTSGTITYVGNAALMPAVSGTLAHPIAINSGVTGTFDSQALAATLSGTISGAGAFAKAGTGILTLSGSLTYAGNTNVDAGTLVYAGGVTSTSAKMLVGYGAGEAAAVIQQAGTLLSFGTATGGQDVTSLGGAGGYGYYRNAGGTLLTGQLGLVGNSAGIATTGVFEQAGGSTTVTAANGWIVYGWTGTDTNGVLNIFDGSVTNNSTGNNTAMAFLASGSSMGMLNLLGPGASFTHATSGRNIDLARTAGNFGGWLNLNGGILTANSVTATVTTTPSFLGLNSGTLRAASSSTLVSNLTAATVWSGGAVIDSNGFSPTISQALLAPVGDGVTTIPVTAGGSGYVGPPAIRITGGGGAGASAIAVVDLDPASPTYGQLTGIQITSSGTGYTSAPTITLVGGTTASTVAATIDVPTLAAGVSGGLTKIGNGQLALSGANTYTGPTTITTGTLQIGGGGATGSLAAATTISIADGAVLAFNRTNDYGAFANLVTGSGSIRMTSGTVGLANPANSYTGGSTLAGGVLRYDDVTALGTGTISFTAAATLRSGVSGTLANAITINSGVIATIDTQTAPATFSGEITGAGTLRKLNGGTLTLTGSSSLGVLQAGTPAATSVFGTLVSSGTITGLTTFSVNTGTLAITDGLLATGTIRVNDGTLNNAVVTQTGGVFLVTGSNSANSNQASFLFGHYSGTATWNISAGTISSTAAVLSLGWDSTSSTFNQSGGTVSLLGLNLGNSRNNAATYTLTGGRLEIGSSGITANASKTVNLGSGTVGALASWASSQNMPLTSPSPGVTFDPSGFDITLSGVLSSTGSLVVSGSGNLILSGANTYTGSTAVTSGTLQVGAGGATGSIASSSAITLGSAGTLVFNRTGSLGSYGMPIDGGGSVILSSGSVTFSGTNTYAGTTTINGGLLTISSTAALPGWDTPGRWTVNPGGGLAFGAGISSADISTMLATGNYGSGGSVGFDTSGGSTTFTSALTGTMGLVKTGSNSLTLTASNAVPGPTTVSGGSLILDNNFALENSTLTIAAATSVTFGPAVLGSSTATLGGLAGSGTLALANPTPQPVNLLLGGNNASTSYAGVISGSGARVTKVGTGTLTLTGANTFSGGLTVSSGTLVYNADAALGAVPAAFTANALVFDGGGLQATVANTTSANRGITLNAGGATFASTSFRVQINGTISGPGSLTLTGTGNTSGDFNLTARNTYSGGTILLPGSYFPLSVSSTSSGGTVVNGPLGTGTITFAGGGMRAGGGANQTLENAIRVTADTPFYSIGAAGDYNLIFNTPIQLSGTSPTLTVLTSPIAGRTGVFFNAGLTDSGGGFGFTKSGTGTLVVGGTSAYSGVTVVANGALRLSSTGALPGGIGLAGGSTALTLSGGVLDLATDDFLRGLGSGANQVQFTASSGFAASGGTRLVNIGGAAGQLTWGMPFFVSGSQSLVLGNVLATGTVNVVNPFALDPAVNSTFDVQNGSGVVDAILSGVLSSSGTFVKAGAGVLALTATNTYTGTTLIAAGGLSPDAPESGGGGPLGIGGAIQFAGGSLRYTANTADYSTRFAASGSAITIDTNGLAVTLGGGIDASNTGGLTRLGSGTLTLAGSNLFTGAVTAGAGGLLATSSDEALGGGSSIVIAGGTLAITGTSPFSSTKILSVSAASGNVLDVTNGTYAGVRINTLSGTLTKTGTGTLSFTGTGNQIRHLIMSGGNVDLASTGTLSFSNAGGSQLTATQSGTFGSSLGGALTFTSPAGDGPNNGAASGVTLTIAARITGTGVYENYYNGSSTGVTVLSNTGNNYAGLTAINDGVVAVPMIGTRGSPSPLGTSGTVSFGGNANATLRYTGTGEATNATLVLTGSTNGGKVEQAGTGLLRFTSNLSVTGSGVKPLELLGSSSGTGEFAGVIGNGAAATALTKTGTGVWVLSGANTYTGATNVSNGILRLSGPGRLGASGSSAITVGGGHLDLGATSQTTGTVTISTAPGFVTGSVALTGGSLSSPLVNVTNGGGLVAIDSILAGSGGLAKTGAGTLRLAAANTFTGALTVTAGVVTGTAVANFGGETSTLTLNGGTLEYTGPSAETARRVAVTGNSTLLLPTSSSTLTLSGSLSGASTLSLNTVTSHVGVAGGLRLTGTSPGFTGPVTVNNGALTITNSQALGGGTKTITVSVNSTGFASLRLDGSAGDITLPANLSFLTSLNADPSGIINVSGSNTIAGNFTLQGGNGVTRISSDGGSLTLSGTFTPSTTNRNLVLDGSSTGRLTGSLQTTSTNTPGLIKQGTGTWTVASSVSSTAALGVQANGGTLVFDFANLASGANLLTGTSGVATLAFGGGTFQVVGRSAGTTSQSFSGATVNAGVQGTLLLDPNGGTTTTVALGGLTRNAGSALVLGPVPAAGLGTLSITTTSTTVAGVYQRLVYATGTSFEWATSSGVTPFAIMPLASGSYTALAASGSNAANALITTGTTLAGALTTNTLKIQDPDIGQSLELASTGTLTLTGGGLLLTGSNDYTISSGTLTASNGSGTYDVLAAQFSTGTLTIASTIANNGGNATSFTKAGPGTLVLAGTNTFTGSLYAAAGTLVLGGSQATASVNSGGGLLRLGSATGIGSGATLTVSTGTFDMNGFSPTVTNLGAGNTFGVITDLSAGTGTSTLTVSTYATNNVDSRIADGPTQKVAVTLYATGNGSVFLRNSYSTFSGGLTLAAIGSGTARFVASNAAMSFGTPGAIESSPYGRGTLTIGLTGTDRAQLYTSNIAGYTVLNDIVFNASPLGADRPGAIRADAALNLLGTLTSGSNPVSLSTNANGATILLGGRITGLNGLQLTSFNTGTGMVVTLNNISGVANDYAGNTQLDGGNVLVLGQADQIPDGAGKGGLVFTGTALTNTGGTPTLRLAGYDETVNSISGTTFGAVIDAFGGTPTFTVGAADASGTFAGRLRNTIPGSILSLVKTGSGILALSGTNDYIGPTAVSGGTLQIGAGGSTGSIATTASISVATGAVLAFNRADAYGGAFDRTITGGGQIVVRGGALTLSGSNSYTGGTVVESGTLLVSNTAALPTNVALTLGSGTGFGTYNFGAVAPTFAALTFAGAGGQLVGTGPVTFFATGSAASVTVLSGTRSLIPNDVVLGSAAAFDVGQAAVLELAGVLSGGSALTKSGSGMLVLSGSNSFADSITIAGGTLAVGDGGVTGSIDSVALIDVSAGGVLAFNRTDSYGGGFDRTIVGDGGVRVLGGTLTLTGINAYLGGTVVESGTLVVGGESAMPLNVAPQIGAGTGFGTLDFGGSGVFPDLVFGGAGGRLTGGGPATLTAVSVLSGTSSIVPVGVTLGSAASFSVAASAAIEVSGTIDGGFGLTKTGAGRLVISASNAYTGATTISDGTLAVVGAGRTPAASAVALSGPFAGFDISAAGGNVTIGGLSGVDGSLVALGANTLTAAVAGSQQFGGVIAGTGGFTKAGPGTLQLTSIQQFTGAMRVDAGTLQLTNADGLQLANRIFIASGARLDATSAGLNVYPGTTLGGFGTAAGDMFLANGSILSPGGSVGLLTGTAGTTTWNGGMTYTFEVNDANGTAGGPYGWDLFSTYGTLAIDSGAEFNPIVVDLASLSGTSAGLAANFNPTFNYAWRFAVAGSEIYTGSPGTFDTGWFQLVTTNFQNSWAGSGFFSLARGDQLPNIPTFSGGSTNELYVVYAAVPEPGLLALAACGLVSLALVARRRRGRSRSR